MGEVRRAGEGYHVLVLGALIGEILGVEVFPSGFGHHFTDAMLVVALAVGIAGVRRSWRVGLAAFLCGAAAWTSDMAGIVWPSFDAEAIAWGLLHGLVAVALIRRTARQKRIRQVEIFDAVSAYIGIGIMFAELYSCVLSVQPTALVVVREATSAPPAYAMVLYYSFVTQLTVGYGDVYPGAASIRFLSVLQSLIGVLYIAIMIARLVSLESTLAYRNQDDE